MVSQTKPEMERKSLFRPALPLILLFICVNILLALLKIGPVHGIQFSTLWAGNLILFMASLLSFLLFRRSLSGNNPHVFLRFVYAGMFLKMAICLAAAVLYLLLTKGEVSENAIFECFGLYFLYTFVEVKLLMRMSKQQKNA
jgi:hypothetical protein